MPADKTTGKSANLVTRNNNTPYAHLGVGRWIVLIFVLAIVSKITDAFITKEGRDRIREFDASFEEQVKSVKPFRLCDIYYKYVLFDQLSTEEIDGEDAKLKLEQWETPWANPVNYAPRYVPLPASLGSVGRVTATAPSFKDGQWVGPWFANTSPLFRIPWGLLYVAYSSYSEGPWALGAVLLALEFGVFAWRGLGGFRENQHWMVHWFGFFLIPIIGGVFLWVLFIATMASAAVLRSALFALDAGAMIGTLPFVGFLVHIAFEERRHSWVERWMERVFHEEVKHARASRS